MKIKVKVAPKKQHILEITTENIKLDSALKLSSIASTGGQAKMLIQDELIKVNGEVCTVRGKKLHDGDKIEYERTVYTVKVKKD